MTASELIPAAEEGTVLVHRLACNDSFIPHHPQLRRTSQPQEAKAFAASKNARRFAPKASDKIGFANEAGIDGGHKAKLHVDGQHRPRGRVLASPISWHG